MTDSSETLHDRLPTPTPDHLLGMDFSSCPDDRVDYMAALSSNSSVSIVDIHPALHVVRHTSPDSPHPVIGVHNPTTTVQEFTIDAHFPDVVEGRAYMVFVGGQVETSACPDAPLRFRLRPGAHVWLSQTTELADIKDPR